MKNIGFTRWRLITRWLSNHKRHLPDTRSGLTKKVCIGGTDVYVSVNLFDDGMPSEIFITANKAGDEMRVYGVLAIMISLGLRYGVPLRAIVDKLKFQRMEPQGFTGDPDIHSAYSISDFVGQWLEKRFL